jgi:hypothetical protein
MLLKSECSKLSVLHVAWHIRSNAKEQMADQPVIIFLCLIEEAFRGLRRYQSPLKNDLTYSGTSLVVFNFATFQVESLVIIYGHRMPTKSS